MEKLLFEMNKIHFVIFIQQACCSKAESPNHESVTKLITGNHYAFYNR